MGKTNEYCQYENYFLVFSLNENVWLCFNSCGIHPFCVLWYKVSSTGHGQIAKY